MTGVLAMFAAACTTSAPARQAVPAAARTAAHSPGPARPQQARTRQATTRPGPVTLAFAGDVHFTGRTARLLNDPATAFGPIASVLKSADFTAVNLETAVTSRGDAAAEDLPLPHRAGGVHRAARRGRRPGHHGEQPRP